MIHEIKQFMFRFNQENKLPLFDKILAYQGILCKKSSKGNIDLTQFSREILRFGKFGNLESFEILMFLII